MAWSRIDGLYLGGKPRRDAHRSPPGRGRKGEPKTLKTPALVVVQRPPDLSVSVPSGEARAAAVEDLSESEADRVLTEAVEPSAHLMSDEWRAFVSLGNAFAAHDTISHSVREYAHGPIHTNSAEGFNDRVRRTASGVFHHISPHLADLYFNEIGLRWSQRVITGQAPRRTRKGREVIKTLWARGPPVLQLPAVFRSAVGREMRRTKAGGIDLVSKVAVFG
jgi:ISXO2-like transposase domain